MDSQLHKALSLGASLVLVASPCCAVPSTQTKATLYGYIYGADGSIKSGSLGISSVTKVAGTNGHYCIKPTSSALQGALTWDVNNSTGFVNVQLTQSSISWPTVGKFVTQITGPHVTAYCASYEIAVSIMEKTGCSTPQPTATTNPSFASCSQGFQSENSDFTVMFW
jgi:hypothetical protein